MAFGGVGVYPIVFLFLGVRGGFTSFAYSAFLVVGFGVKKRQSLGGDGCLISDMDDGKWAIGGNSVELCDDYILEERGEKVK